MSRSDTSPSDTSPSDSSRSDSSPSGGDAGFAVVVPVHDGAAFVAETVRSVMEQSHPPDQVIVVDDGSRDGSAQVVRDRFPEVTVIESPNRGRSAARNLGLAHARADWVCFCDHDDLWHRDKLARTRAYLDEHPDCRAVRHPMWYFSATDDARPAFGFRRDFVAADLDACHAQAERHPTTVNDFSYLETHGRDLEVMFERTVGFTSATVIDRRLAIHAGGFPVYAAGGEDWLFFLQVARLAAWHTLDEPLGFARFHPHQGTNDSGAARGVLAVKVAAWYAGRPFPERRDPAEVTAALATYGRAYAVEVGAHLGADLARGDHRSARVDGRLAGLLLPRWSDRARALGIAGRAALREVARRGGAR